MNQAALKQEILALHRQFIEAHLRNEVESSNFK